MADTGNTATIVFGTSGFTANYTRIGSTSQERESLEVTTIATTGEKLYQPNDLIEPGEFSCEFHWDQSASTFPPISAVAETITVTYPLKAGESTAATLAGTGYLKSSSGPDLVNGEIMSGEFTVQWDGTTGPSYTAGAA